MRHLPKQNHDPNLLVGLDTCDDAGAYRLTDDLAMIQTVDYFTPVVDDAYMFGQIAAANALSDVYAMGGKPTTVMNIVGFPIKKLPPEILADILRGAADKTKEAGAIIVGGHSIDDQEPKFGLSVTGLAHPDRIFKNVGAKPCDSLVLTKPIGVGILTTGIKREAVTAEQEQAVTDTMALLNKQAAELLEGLHPNAVTDVTGFGLLGHSYEMANGSDITFELVMNQVPMLDGTRDLAERGIVPGGSKANERWLEGCVEYGDSITSVEKSILCDAITSGGLLISLPATEAEQYVASMQQAGAFATIIGQVTEKQSKPIIVR
ncbi:selenide,water dikinase [Halalkalibacter akibai JCM 9157]|uniref:Selenide, water dikinase n=1 Tax=Halalkalibacter akibai (strain ATCC 43226 / DSM 21942 / CIP 109018 / JCM 9157 / 1139) TaxID=1236973 RepID=W4QUW9_HALA3|nr:selenide,water dikinase [Halalkalibacter akibai JCM 9157]